MAPFRVSHNWLTAKPWNPSPYIDTKQHLPYLTRLLRKTLRWDTTIWTYPVLILAGWRRRRRSRQVDRLLMHISCRTHDIQNITMFLRLLACCAAIVALVSVP